MSRVPANTLSMLAQPSARVLVVRNTAQSFCMVFCISARSCAVGVLPLACRILSGRQVRGRCPAVVMAHLVEAGDRVLAGVLDLLVRLSGRHLLRDAVGGGAAEH